MPVCTQCNLYFYSHSPPPTCKGDLVASGLLDKYDDYESGLPEKRERARRDGLCFKSGKRNVRFDMETLVVVAWTMREKPEKPKCQPPEPSLAPGETVSL